GLDQRPGLRREALVAVHVAVAAAVVAAADGHLQEEAPRLARRPEDAPDVIHRGWMYPAARASASHREGRDRWRLLEGLALVREVGRGSPAQRGVGVARADELERSAGG